MKCSKCQHFNACHRCDRLFVVPTVGFRLLYGLVIITLQRRHLVRTNATANPTAEWIARQITEAFPGVQRVHYGIFVFDGAGKFTGKQSSSRGGKIGRENLEGTYTLDADCTGTMTFGGIMNPSSNVHWDLYVTEDHKRGHMIRMDEGNMAVRSFEK
jgi:hypothetical protein